MGKRRNILVILLAVSLLALIMGGNNTRPEVELGNLEAAESCSFIAGRAPVADAQASYIVAVPAAASMDVSSRAGIAEASDFLSEGLNIVFRRFQQRLPVPYDTSRRRLLLRVLRI